MTSSRRRRRPAVDANRAVSRSPGFGWRRILPAAGLVALVLAVYANSLGAGFALDGKGLVLQDPRVRAATAENVALIREHTYWWPYGESGLYRPATTLSFLVDYAMLGRGQRPAGYHATNVLLHALNVLLLFALARRLSEDVRIAWFVAALWAVHPVLTEVVANVAGRADLLAAGAVLSGVLCYDHSRSAVGWHRAAWLAALAASALVGVLSKENAIVVVGGVGLYEIARWGRRSVQYLTRAAAALAVPLLAAFALRSAALAAAGSAQFPFTDNPVIGSSFATRVVTALAVMGRYLWLLAWPGTLSADYSYSAVLPATGRTTDWLAWLTLTVAVILAAAAARRSRTIFFWSALAIGTYLPTSNLLIVIGSIMAERFLYLPSAGILACAVVAVFAGARRLGLGTYAPLVLGLVLVLLGARTVDRNTDWRDDVTLATATVQAVPESAKAHRMLAAALYDADRSRLDDAIAEATVALGIVDALPDALSDGELYMQAAGYWIEKGERAWRAGPDDREPIVPSALREPYERALPLLGRAEAIGEAQRNATTAAGFAPHFATVYALQATALLRLGNLADARQAADRARQLAPLDPQGHARVAEVLLAADRTDEAAVALTLGLMLADDGGRLAGVLAGLYRAGLDSEGCATLGPDTAPTLNPKCPVVRRHVCTAAGEALALLSGTNQAPDRAQRLRATAVQQFGCSEAALGPPGQ